MAYTISITRSGDARYDSISDDLSVDDQLDAFNELEQDIPASEIRQVLDADPEFKRQGDEDSCHYIWTANPEGSDVLFSIDPHEGTLEVNDPTETIAKKLYAIATQLGAKVHGDDGEYYGSDGKVISED